MLMVAPFIAMKLFPTHVKAADTKTRFLLMLAVCVLYFVGGMSLQAALTKKISTVPVEEVVEEIDPGIIPARVIISKITVDAPIERVGLRSDGRMDIPDSSTAVGWFHLGYEPGEEGSAVLAGHLDTMRGTPAVFWRLRRLRPGDIVEVEDRKGKRLQFRVTHRATYPMDDAPLLDIFGPSDTPRLTLITCNGKWKEELQTYDRRLVVYTELVSLSSSPL